MALFGRSLKLTSDARVAADGDSDAGSGPRHTVGDLLRDTRKSYGGDINRIAATLRVRPSYLTAIEESRYDELPGPVYAQGFVRAYAVHLGLDGDEAIRRFKQEAAGLEVTRDLSFPVQLAARSIPGGTMVLAALILALCGYGLWYYVSTSDRSHPERVSAVPPDLVAATKVPIPDAPPSSTPAPATAQPRDAPTATNATAPPAPAGTPPDAGVSSLGATSTPSPSPAAQAPSAPATASAPSHVYGAAPNIPARIVVHAVKDAWVQIRNGDDVLIQRTLHAGDSVRVPAGSGLSFRTGNGAGIQLEIDGKLFKPLSGAVRTFALDANRLAANNGNPPRSAELDSPVPPRAAQ